MRIRTHDVELDLVSEHDLPLSLRPALLAGIAIVERAGPAMLEMLRAHTSGENRTRFGRLAATMIAVDRAHHRPMQMQLI